MKKTIIGISLFLITSCASQSTSLIRTVADQQDEFVKTIVIDGKKTLASKKKHIVVAQLSDERFTGYNHSILIYVKNINKEPILFGIENVHVTSNSTPITVATKEMLMRNIQNRVQQRNTWAVVGAALSGIGNAAEASSIDNKQTSTFSGTYSDGYSQGTFRGQATTDDNVANELQRMRLQQEEERERIRNQQNQQVYDNQVQNAVSRINQTYLTANTLFPNDGYEGHIAFSVPHKAYDQNRNAKIKVEVILEGDAHNFFFDFKR